MNTFALITPDDVRTRLSQCFHGPLSNYKIPDLNMIKHWIITRTSEVNEFHCFVLIQIFCQNVLNHFKQGEMYNLLWTMTELVSDCLNYRMVRRNRPPSGRRTGWSAPYNLIMYSDEEEMVLTTGCIRHLEPKCIYPRTSDCHFGKYEHHTRLEDFTSWLQYDNYWIYIRNHYHNQVYSFYAGNIVHMRRSRRISGNLSNRQNRMNANASSSDLQNNNNSLPNNNNSGIVY